MVLSSSLPAGCSNYLSEHAQEPAQASARIDAGDKQCSTLGWITYWDHERGLESYLNNKDVINYIAFFWYTLDKQGQIRPYTLAREDQSLIREIQSHGTKVLATITNLPDDEVEGDTDWDHKRLFPILFDSERRKEHVQALVELVRTRGFDGLNIDYEFLPGKYRRGFTGFIESLAIELHRHDKILAVALHPKTRESDPKEDNGSHAQDWRKLARHADQLHLMTYGEHYPGGSPGPVASLRWFGRVVDYAYRDVENQTNKLFAGIPFYGEMWRQENLLAYEGPDINLTYADIQQMKKTYEAKETWDRESSSPSISYRDDKTSVTVWFEDSRSISEKISLARNLGVCNFAIWRLGGEHRNFWPAFRSG